MTRLVTDDLCGPSMMGSYTVGPSHDVVTWGCRGCGCRGMVTALRGTSRAAMIKRAFASHATVSPECRQRPVARMDLRAGPPQITEASGQ
jgi:hypothetical protein